MPGISEEGRTWIGGEGEGMVTVEGAGEVGEGTRDDESELAVAPGEFCCK